MPHIADMKPHGRFHMVDLDRVGGVPVVMRELLEAGLIDGDCLTVTGVDGRREPRGHRSAGTRRRGRPPPGRSRSTRPGASPSSRARSHPRGAS